MNKRVKGETMLSAAAGVRCAMLALCPDPDAEAGACDGVR
jgi:hypothetical protein